MVEVTREVQTISTCKRCNNAFSWTKKFGRNERGKIVVNGAPPAYCPRCHPFATYMAPRERDEIIDSKGKCEKCGATKNLVLHHIDFNPKNNVITNFLVLCSRCHPKLTYYLLNHLTPTQKAQISKEFLEEGLRNTAGI